MILEAIVTTTNKDGLLNVAPMGPLMRDDDDHFELRPFDTSQTYKNLTQNPIGVLHVTDDVMLFAASAINKLDVAPETSNSTKGGLILDDCCYWMEFAAKEIQTNSPRKSFHCDITERGNRRRFYGFNRAKHAVLEATILATRIDFIPIEEIQSQYQRFATIVEKTGGDKEIQAFNLLKNFVEVGT